MSSFGSKIKFLNLILNESSKKTADVEDSLFSRFLKTNSFVESKNLIVDNKESIIKELLESNKPLLFSIKKGNKWQLQSIKWTLEIPELLKIIADAVIKNTQPDNININFISEYFFDHIKRKKVKSNELLKYFKINNKKHYNYLESIIKYLPLGLALKLIKENLKLISNLDKKSLSEVLKDPVVITKINKYTSLRDFLGNVEFPNVSKSELINYMIDISSYDDLFKKSILKGDYFEDLRKFNIDYFEKLGGKLILDPKFMNDFKDYLKNYTIIEDDFFVKPEDFGPIPDQVIAKLVTNNDYKDIKKLHLYRSLYYLTPSSRNLLFKDDEFVHDALVEDWRNSEFIDLNKVNGVLKIAKDYYFKNIKGDIDNIQDFFEKSPHIFMDLLKSYDEVYNDYIQFFYEDPDQLFFSNPSYFTTNEIRKDEKLLDHILDLAIRDDLKYDLKHINSLSLSEIKKNPKYIIYISESLVGRGSSIFNYPPSMYEFKILEGNSVWDEVVNNFVMGWVSSDMDIGGNRPDIINYIINTGNGLDILVKNGFHLVHGKKLSAVLQNEETATIFIKNPVIFNEVKEALFDGALKIYDLGLKFNSIFIHMFKDPEVMDYLFNELKKDPHNLNFIPRGALMDFVKNPKIYEFIKSKLDNEKISLSSAIMKEGFTFIMNNDTDFLLRHLYVEALYDLNEDTYNKLKNNKKFLDVVIKLISSDRFRVHLDDDNLIKGLSILIKENSNILDVLIDKKIRYFFSILRSGSGLFNNHILYPDVYGYN